jgi:transcriptional regulator NrdR family protein
VERGEDLVHASRAKPSTGNFGVVKLTKLNSPFEGLYCPQCNQYHNNFSVLTTRLEARAIRRQRKCNTCNHGITTREMEESTLNLFTSGDSVKELRELLKEVKGLKSGLDHEMSRFEKLKTFLQLLLE